MMTFEDIAYGPVRSRRLGLSLGVNLMPQKRKVCSFECIYCECGFTDKSLTDRIPSREEVKSSLERKLTQLASESQMLDVITFAGNGEPTLHPDFPGVIADTIELRDKLHPQAKISVLSNATMIHKPEIRAALSVVDYNILKLDSAVEQTMRLMDAPVSSSFTVESLVRNLEHFHGDFILQTMFLRGTVDGQIVDNTTAVEIEAWQKVVMKLRPAQVMIYPIDRQTPVETLEKISKEELEQIAAPLRAEGIDVLTV